MKFHAYFFAALIAVSAAQVGADEAPVTLQNQTVATQDVGRAAYKEGLVITKGTQLLAFSPKLAWTISALNIDSKKFFVPVGYMGTVAAMKNVEGGWVGSGHGGEIIEKIELEADGKTISFDKPFDISGKKFALKKQSKIGPYRLWATTSFDGKTLQEKFDYEVVEDDKDVSLIYAFMYSMTNETEQWQAQLADGSIEKGKFTDDDTFTLKKDIRWFAAYDSADGIGMTYVYPKAYVGHVGFSNAIWNRKTDNKLYFRPELTHGIGAKFGYEVTIQLFEATPEKWEDQATQIAGELMKSMVK